MITLERIHTVRTDAKAADFHAKCLSVPYPAAVVYYRSSTRLRPPLTFQHGRLARRCASSGGYLAVEEKNGPGVISEVLDSWYRYLNNAYTLHP